MSIQSEQQVLFTGRKIRLERDSFFEENFDKDLSQIDFSKCSPDLKKLIQIFSDIKSGANDKYLFGVFGHNSQNLIWEAYELVNPLDSDKKDCVMIRSDKLRDGRDFFGICAEILVNFIESNIPSLVQTETVAGSYTYSALCRIKHTFEAGESLYLACFSPTSTVNRSQYMASHCKLFLNKIQKVEGFQKTKIILQIELPLGEIYPALLDWFKSVETENFKIIFNCVEKAHIVQKAEGYEIHGAKDNMDSKFRFVNNYMKAEDLVFSE